jgi:hypothetical protein
MTYLFVHFFVASQHPGNYKREFIEADRLTVTYLKLLEL